MTPRQPGSDRGIIYVATGERYVREALESARSAREHMPNVPIAMFTDRPELAGPPVDIVLTIDNPRRDFAEKIPPLTRSPFEKTLFLDTDTLVCGNCEELFDMLDRFELLVAHDPWRADYNFETLPPCFPTMNTGVIAYRKTPAFEALVRDWLDTHFARFAHMEPNDQPAFRHALYHSNLRFLVLPGEYNLRLYHPCFVGGHAAVKIVHDRNPFAARIVRALNRYPRPRVFGYTAPRLVLLYYATKTVKVARARAARLRQKVAGWFKPRPAPAPREPAHSPNDGGGS
jgi:hypothetical protein